MVPEGRVADTLGGQSPVDGEGLGGGPWAGSDHAISVFLGQGPDGDYKYSASLTANTVSACAAAARVRCLTSTLFEITLWRAVDVLRGVVGLVASETSTYISTRLDST
jgi:hypothetical protein